MKKVIVIILLTFILFFIGNISAKAIEGYCYYGNPPQVYVKVVDNSVHVVKYDINDTWKFNPSYSTNLDIKDWKDSTGRYYCRNYIYYFRNQNAEKTVYYRRFSVLNNEKIFYALAKSGENINGVVSGTADMTKDKSQTNSEVLDEKGSDGSGGSSTRLPESKETPLNEENSGSERSVNDEDQYAVYEENSNNYFCEQKEVLKVLNIIGYLLMAIKIIVPILLIIFGTIDFGKAVVTSSEDNIKKASGAIVRRILAGLIIFFVPTVINVLLNLIVGFSDIQDSYKKCSDCLFSLKGCDNYANK